MRYGTRPAWWHDFAWCCWRFYDARGRQVACITDEAYSRHLGYGAGPGRGPAAVWSGD